MEDKLETIIYSSHGDFDSGVTVSAGISSERMVLEYSEWNYSNYASEDKDIPYGENLNIKRAFFNRDALWKLAGQLNCHIVDVPAILADKFGTNDEFDSQGKYAYDDILRYASNYKIDFTETSQE